MPSIEAPDPATGEMVPGDTDPTLSDPGWPDKLQWRADFDDLSAKATSEIAWLEATIPNIDTMTAVEVRDVAKRLAQENLLTIKAWRHVLRRLG